MDGPPPAPASGLGVQLEARAGFLCTDVNGSWLSGAYVSVSHTFSEPLFGE